MFTNPSAPNLADFAAYVYAQGVPTASLPEGALTGVTIDTSGNVTATTATNVGAGMYLVGDGIAAGTLILTWSGTSGTVSPAPLAAISASTASAYSQYLQWSLTQAMGSALVPPADMAPILYVMAVYQLGMHDLLKMAQDPAGSTFFTTQRQNFKLMGFPQAPVVSSADQGTSQTLVEPEFLKTLTLSAMDLMRTPWGIQYVEYAQAYGPNIVGVS